MSSLENNEHEENIKMDISEWNTRSCFSRTGSEKYFGYGSRGQDII
jgi:hypothetical protein